MEVRGIEKVPQMDEMSEKKNEKDKRKVSWRKGVGEEVKYGSS